jgi:uncharacterized phiE125 gp8 family phage protein
MLRRVIRKSQPVAEPVSLAEAKETLRIPTGQTIDDGLITAYISAAREQAEQFIDSAVSSADFDVVFSEVASDQFYIQYPASAVSAVTYRDASNAEQAATYTYDADLNTLFFEEVVTGTNLKISLTAGYSADWPQSMKQAVLMLVGDLYTGRASSEYVNKAAMTMLMPFKNRPIV